MLRLAFRSKLRRKAEVDLELKIDAAIVPAVGIGTTVDLRQLWFWTLSQLPRNRYRKLLVRMAVEQSTYFDISRRIRKIWDG